MAKQLGFYFDASACSGCKACQVACQDKNDLSAELLWRRIYRYARGSWIPQGEHMIPNDISVYTVSSACMHCEEPTCVDVCPTAAISKRDDGIVLIDDDRCIGCRYCEWACPYAAPRFDDKSGVMTKCTFCADLIDQGENPACVDSCVMRALDFGDVDELRAKYGDVAGIEPLPEAKYTKPAVVITPHKDAQMSGTGTGRVDNLPEEV